MIRFDLIWCFEKRAIGLRYVSVLLMTSLFNSIFILNIFEQLLHKQFKKFHQPTAQGFFHQQARGGGFLPVDFLRWFAKNSENSVKFKETRCFESSITKFYHGKSCNELWNIFVNAYKATLPTLNKAKILLLDFFLEYTSMWIHP